MTVKMDLNSMDPDEAQTEKKASILHKKYTNMMLPYLHDWLMVELVEEKLNDSGPCTWHWSQSTPSPSRRPTASLERQLKEKGEVAKELLVELKKKKGVH